MASWPSPDDYTESRPTTINPAKLHEFGDSMDSETTNPTKMEMIKRPRPNPSEIPRIPRISSHWDPTVGSSTPDWDKQCWGSTPADANVKGWQRYYFDTRIKGYWTNIYIPPDPWANLGDMVLIDLPSGSIYDAYLLRADIAKNENQFRRLQIVHSPFHERYTLFDRSGRVGLPGYCNRKMDSWVGDDLRGIVEEFKKLFRQYTGMEWASRYSTQTRETRSYPLPPQLYTYVDLDYSRQVSDDPYSIQRQVELPNYQAMNANIDEPVRLLMEDMLYGGPVSSLNSPNSNTPSIPGSSFCPYTAPYQSLSLRAITTAFHTLKQIAGYLDTPVATDQSKSKSPKNKTRNNEKPGTIRWKTIISASSRYRSEIPFCAGWHNSSRPGVISNYHTLFLELRFLHSLYPSSPPPGIASLMDEISRRGSLQVWAYGKALTTQPLYQAYSSLRHGFRLLTDTSSLEFRELSAYLHNSCQHQTHHINFEIQGIYRVFTKSGLTNPYHDWLRSTSEDQAYSSTRRNRLLLWHGTPLDSLLGILELGLQIRKRFPDPPPLPPAPKPSTRKLPARTAARRQNSTTTTYTNTNTLQLNFPIPPPPPPFQTSALYNPPIKPGIISHTKPKQVPLSTYRNLNRTTGMARTTAAATRAAILRRTAGGCMFGDGIYLADASSKSAGYCGYRNVGAFSLAAGRDTGNEGTEAILLLCEADVGSREERVRSLYSLPDGHELVREFQEEEKRKREAAAAATTTATDGDIKRVDTCNTEGDWFHLTGNDQGNRGGYFMGKLKNNGGGIGTGVRCIEGVGRTGPRNGPEGWKKVGWDLGWDWNKTGGASSNPGSPKSQENGGSGACGRSGLGGSDYGDVWMPDTSRPYGLVVQEAALAFNEYVLYNPAHVQIRYIFRVKIKDNVRYR